MSKRYPGGLISKTPVVPTRSSAPGVWTLDQAIAYSRAGTWPIGVTGYYLIQYLGATGTTTCYDVAIDSSGYIYVAMDGGNEGGGGAAIVKYDPAGNIQWQKFLGSTDEDFRSVAVDSSGNVYVTGRQFYSTSYAYLIAKYDSSGNLLWQRRLNASTPQYGFGIAVDPSENAYVTGYSNTLDSIVIAKYSASGILQWQRRLNALNSAELGDSIAVDSSGNVYIIGYTTNTVGVDHLDIIIAKYDTSGNILWQRTLGSASNLNDDGTGIAVDPSGNIYICSNSPTGFASGGAAAAANSATDILIAKYDTSGNILWQRVLSRSGYDACLDIALDSSNNLYVCGSTDIQANTSLIVKYDTSGNLLFQRLLTGASNAYGITIDQSNFFNDMCVVGANGFITKLPSDGSKTGTYDSFTYSVTSAFANSAGSFVNAASILDASVAGLTNGATTLISNNGTMTITSKIVIST
jgi:hypothetical protein